MKNKNRAVVAATEGTKNVLSSGSSAAIVKSSLVSFDTTKTMQQHRLTVDGALPFVNSAKVATDKGRGMMVLCAGVGVTVIGDVPSVEL